MQKQKSFKTVFEGSIKTRSITYEKGQISGVSRLATYLLVGGNLEQTMSQKPSIKHHYLPVFYQNGFCNESKMIHVYDKKNDVFLEESPPIRHFLVKNLNNYRFNNEIITSTEESFFTPLDTRCAKLFNKINFNDPNSDLTASLDRMDILYFMTHLFWRTPSSDNDFRSVIEKEGACNNYFGLSNKETGERLNDEDFPEFKERILSDSEFLKNLKIHVPINNAKQELLDLVKKWKIFTLTDDSISKFIIGDSPIINQNSDIKLSKIFDNVIFPLSKNKILILNANSPEFIDNNIVNRINLSIFHNSKRFVASGNKNNLESIILCYKQLMETDKKFDHLEHTFGLINNISKFKTFEDYKTDFDNKTGGNV